MPALANDNLIELAKRYAAKAGVPASLVYAMIMSESTGHPDAVNNRTGAKGLMQLMGPAAGEQGFTHADMANPEKNVEAGAGYIGRMLNRFQDPRRALSAYNAGPGATRRHEDIAPSAEPYVTKVSGMVDDLTRPGQPFEGESNAGEDALSPEFLQKQKIQETIDKLLSVQPQVPMRDAGSDVDYSKQGIRRMLQSVYSP